MNSEIIQETGQTQEKMGAIQKIIGVFTAPGKTFAAIDVHPSWLLPLLIIAIVNLVFVSVAGNIITQETLAQQEQKMLEKGMDSDQIGQALVTTEKAMKFTVPVFAVVGPVVVLMIVAGVFMFVSNVILGGSSTYKKVLSVTTYSWLIFTVGALIALPIVLAKETINVTFSLATIMSEEGKETFLYKFFSKIDLFAIWWIAVYSIGLAVIYKMKTQKTATVVASVYLIYAVVASSLSGLF